MGSHLLTIHGHKVRCDDDRGYRGVKHLAYDLPEDEARALFAQTEQSKEVEFFDKENRKFVLADGENGEFTVVAAYQDTGWI